MQFNDLLLKEGLDPAEVMVFRHRPQEPKLRKVLPWLVEEKHEVFNCYQQTQGPIVEKALQGAKFVASFIGHEAGKAVFAGLYELKDYWPLSFDQFWSIRAHKVLRDQYGLLGMTDKHATTIWFDLVGLPFRSDWKGKLIVSWPGKELSWWRWADRNEFMILSILEDSIFECGMPPWNRLTLTWHQLGTLPRKWREELSRWRGIYFILDESDGRGYVGAAYGISNLLGRWLEYAKSGHGGNKRLKERDPAHFRFSILQIVPHDMSEDDVQAIENTWKERLHTREFGLNDH